MRLTKPHEKRFVALALAFFVVLAALAELILVVEFHPTRSGGFAGNGVTLSGAAAAAEGWPASTPQPQPWPDPNSWLLMKSFGQRHYDVRGENPSSVSGNGFAMILTQSGWPLPVLESKEMWWDWNDPALSGYESNPPTRVLYANLALNALIGGLALWLLAFLPMLLYLFSKRRFWARKGRCTFCGYDIRDLPKCPECGATRADMGRDPLPAA